MDGLISGGRGFKMGLYGTMDTENSAGSKWETRRKTKGLATCI